MTRTLSGDMVRRRPALKAIRSHQRPVSPNTAENRTSGHDPRTPVACGLSALVRGPRVLVRGGTPPPFPGGPDPRAPRMLDLCRSQNARRRHTDGGFAQLGDGVGSRRMEELDSPFTLVGYLAHFSDGGVEHLLDEPR
jgi:hypothetical protein